MMNGRNKNRNNITIHKTTTKLSMWKSIKIGEQAASLRCSRCGREKFIYLADKHAQSIDFYHKLFSLPWNLFTLYCALLVRLASARTLWMRCQNCQSKSPAWYSENLMTLHWMPPLKSLMLGKGPSKVTKCLGRGWGNIDDIKDRTTPWGDRDTTECSPRKTLTGCFHLPIRDLWSARGVTTCEIQT